MIKIQGLLRSPLIVSWSCKNRPEKRLSLAVICISYRSSQCHWPYPWRGEYFPPSTPCSNPFLTCNMADRSKMCFKWLVCIFLYFFGSSGWINVFLPEGLTWWFYSTFSVAGRVSMNPEFLFYVDTHWWTIQTRKCLPLGNGHTYQYLIVWEHNNKICWLTNSIWSDWLVGYRPLFISWALRRF